MRYEEFHAEWFARWRRIEVLADELRDPKNTLDFIPGGAKREQYEQEFIDFARLVMTKVPEGEGRDHALGCIASVYQLEMPRLPDISPVRH